MKVYIKRFYDALAHMKFLERRHLDERLSNTYKLPGGANEDFRELWKESCWHKWFAENDDGGKGPKKEGWDYQTLVGDGKHKEHMILNEGVEPKGKLFSGWLSYMNYRDFKREPDYQVGFLCVSASYLFNSYSGIFGLSGSVGGEAELKYLAKTFGSTVFNVPRFLNTCANTTKVPAVNQGVMLQPNMESQVLKVVELTKKHYEKVPVIIITSGGSQMVDRVYKELQSAGLKCDPREDILKLTFRDEKGQIVGHARWREIIEATTRPTGIVDRHCRVCVTDKFGGRGHDFSVKDPDVDVNGGVLVIATTVPDEREWIQWIGRTARQDLKGQYYVVLSKTDEMLTRDQPLVTALEQAIGQNKPGKAVSELLNVHNRSIGKRLDEISKEQEKGHLVNKLCEDYYKKCSRESGEQWPSKKYKDKDRLLEASLQVCGGIVRDKSKTTEHINQESKSLFEKCGL